MKKVWMALALAAFVSVGAAAMAQDVKVGVAWFGKSGMADRVVKGMEDRLAQVAPQIKLEFHKDLADATALQEVVQGFQANKVGMVIMRSSGTTTVGKMNPTIPTFIGASNDPKELGVIQNVNAPEGKITGVTYSLSAESQFSTFTAILPSMKSVYLLLEEGHPSAPINNEDTKAVCAKLGLGFQSKFFTNTDDLAATVAAEKDNYSIFLIGAQSLIMDNAALIVKAAGSTPVMAYAQKPVKDGALCGLAADDIKLGGMLADSMVDVLVNGKAISSVPVKFDTKPKLYINAAAVERLGLDIPYDIISLAEIIE